MMRRFRIAVRAVAMTLAIAWAVSSLCLNAQEQAKSKPGSLDGLKGEFTTAMQAWQEKYSADLTTPSPQLIERYDTWPGWTMVPRVIELATGNAESPDSFDTLLWYLELSRAVGPFDKEIYASEEQAMTVLRTRYISNPRITEVLKDCSSYATPGREALLRECATQGSSHEVRGLACYYLAEHLRNKERLATLLAKHDQLSSDEAWQKHLVERRSPESVKALRAIDSKTTLAEVDAVDRRVLKEFGDVQSPYELPFRNGRPTLAFLDGFRRAQQQAISVGKPAPELASKDLDGNKRALSDYQGKIVLLHFWATWCPPCVEKFPQLQALAKKHADQPFQILGVNYDRDRKAAVKYLAVNNIAWPSWWAEAMGESMGHWFVDGRASPSILVLGRSGVLRYHDKEGDALDKAIDQRLREPSDEGAAKP